MKVQNIIPKPLDHIGKADMEDTASGVDRPLLFKSQLTTESEAVYTRRIEKLIADIESQGKLLAKRADMGDLQKYREMITSLINETVSNGYVFHKEGKISANGRSKIFVTIRQINEKLDGMTKKLLNEEKGNIDLLDGVDDIRGLLIDMYL